MHDPGLPVKLGACSNGEVPPTRPGPVVREAVRRATVECAETARRIGMDRRRFLRTAMGSAVTLLALDACSRESGGTGGAFSVPSSATSEPDVAVDALGGDEIVVDVQTHLLEYDRSSPLGDGYFGSGFPQSACGEEDPRACFTTEKWQDLVFDKSDTRLAVLSAIPVVGDVDPLSIDVMEEARRRVEEVCDDARVLIQGHAVPNIGDFAAARDRMLEVAESHELSAWKVYTHAGPGFRLDDGDPDGAQVGAAFLDAVRATDVPVVAVHKGLSGNDKWASPVDVGPAAAANPDLTFLVYHSGYESGEGPADERPDEGVNRLLGSVRDAGIGPGGNVYAELGSTWRQAMTDVDDAAHLLGKLLTTLGPERILWGTDSLWYGSPQDQIQAFRRFQISDEFQDRFGYPALTDEIKARILGGNALELHGIDAADIACTTTREDREDARVHGAPDRLLGPGSVEQARRLFASEHPWFFSL